MLRQNAIGNLCHLAGHHGTKNGGDVGTAFFHAENGICLKVLVRNQLGDIALKNPDSLYRCSFLGNPGIQYLQFVVNGAETPGLLVIQCSVYVL